MLMYEEFLIVVVENECVLNFRLFIYVFLEYGVEFFIFFYLLVRRRLLFIFDEFIVVEEEIMK